MADEESLANFMAVTGASASEAHFHLEASGGNLELAVAQYLDQGTNNFLSASGENAGGGSHGVLGEENGDEEIRAPDRAKQQRLLESPLGGVGYEAEKVGTRASAFADYSEMQSDDEDEKDEGSVGGGGTQQKGLAQLFADPVRLMHSGDFQSARRRAKEETKWLLVSITDESFESARMNRDVWSDETVEAVVESQFVLWIRNKIDHEAIVYADRYDRERTVIAPNTLYRVHPVHPHLGVVDARTGRRVWKREGPISAEKLIETLTDLVDRHDLEAAPRAPDLPPPLLSPPNIPILPHLPPAPSPIQAQEEPPWNSFAQPAGDGSKGTVLVQFRLLEADTNKPFTRKRRFHADDTVGSLFKFVQIESGAGSRHFELRFGYPPTQLWPLADSTVSQAQLNNGSVQMKFV